MQNSFITTNLEIKRIGQNIQVARKRRKMSASTLAAKANVSRQSLLRIEEGDPSVGISKVFNVLNALGLLNGISNYVNPELDRAQALKEVQELRESKKKTNKTAVFTEDDLNF